MSIQDLHKHKGRQRCAPNLSFDGGGGVDSIQIKKKNHNQN